MKKLIVNMVVGVVLFVASLAGGLAATGRLDREGLADIPLLRELLPAPPEVAEGGDAATAGSHATPAGETADAAHVGGAPDATDSGLSPALQEEPRRTKTGRSAENPEEPAGDGAAGAGAPEAAGGQRPASATLPRDDPRAPHRGTERHAAEVDFTLRELALARDRADRYAPGGYFTFPGMPAGLTADQLNEAWQRVQGELADLERRRTALDLRQSELEELADDVSRRHLELGRLREELVTAQRALDERIAKFQEQVKLVRNDEVAALRRNAQTLESFEPAKAAELVTEQWGTDAGQTEILKTFEFMSKDSVNEIIQELANPMIQDVLKKRLTVSKEAAPSAGRRR